MFLYHGTTEEIARKSLTRGLLPRELSGAESVWDCPSCPEYVYLTTGYAPYFALNASKDDKWGIIEVDLDCLDPDEMYPDEDFLEQATRGKGPAPKRLSMKDRTAWFRDHLPTFKHHWEDSLEGLGTATHYGSIPASAISRVSIYDPRSNQSISTLAADPMITIMNYQIMGGTKYRALTSWFMGEKVTPADIDPVWHSLTMSGDVPKMMKEQIESFGKALKNRSGLEVINNPQYDVTDCDW